MAAGYPAGGADNAGSACAQRGEEQDRRRRVIDRRLGGDVVGAAVLVGDRTVEDTKRPARAKSLLADLAERRRSADHGARRQPVVWREHRGPAVDLLRAAGAGTGEQ